ncbi:MAG TPA: hypothetical protein VFU04_09135 [Solirubrobacterales bacterium]|nr:hypothetical protein [Solirubrobacterales bacterium]
MNTLLELASQLRQEQTPISPHVVDPTEADGFAPQDRHALVIEAVREGYLLHYGEPRLLAGHDADLALLAGDYLYALGIERLAQTGDTAAVAVLADLISRCAQLHTEGREAEVPDAWDAAIAELA